MERKILISVVVLLLILGGVVFGVSGNGKVETTGLKTMDLIRTVKISGKVVPEERVDLSFEVGGTVTSVDKRVGQIVSKGDVLARLDSGGVSAEIAKAQAELNSAEAGLSKLEGTQVYENSISNAKRSVTQSILNAYSATVDAVNSKSDQVFYNPNSRVSPPDIIGTITGYDELVESVENQRFAIGGSLDRWKDLINGLTISSGYSDTQLSLSKKYLDEAVSFVSDLSRVVSLFEVSQSMTQSQIDTYKATVTSARDSLSVASKDLIDKENNLLTLLSDVPVQVARVEAARATVLNLNYTLAKSTLKSPIDGVVAKQDAKVGEAATVGDNVVSVISRKYIVEAYVPEVSIVGIKIGDTARVLLEAYDDRSGFEAGVEEIDPAETIRDGVSTYKVKLAFTGEHDILRSGMTANIEIQTFKKSGVEALPDRTILREETESFVYILNAENEKEKRVVTLGARDSRGNVEVLSGLKPEDRVFINPKEE